MLKELFFVFLGFIFLYLTTTFGVYAVVALLLVIELFSAYNKEKSYVLSLTIGMFIYLVFSLINDPSVINFEYFLYIAAYLFVSTKGKEWFINNNVNSYLYLLFALSFPVFLDFVTKLLDLNLDFLLFITFFLLFLRLSDWILTSKLSVLLFTIIQVVSVPLYESHLVSSNMKIVFILFLITWALIKCIPGGKNELSNIFNRKLFREGRQGLHQRLSRF